jgi:hypothetical protein
MAGFVDRALLQLHEAAALEGLLRGSAPAPYPHLKRLIAAVFDDGPASVDRIDDVSVLSIDPFVQIPATTAIRGTLTTSQPTYAQSEVRGELIAHYGPSAHLIARVLLRVVVETDAGGIESVVMSSIDNVTDLDDFASRFRYIDLPAFLSAHKITTVEQLRESAQYLLAEIRLARPPAFDPDDPANSYAVEVDIAFAICGELDLAAGLAAGRELAAAGVSRAPGPRNDVLGVAGRPFAVAVIFPRSQGQSGPSTAQVDALFGAAGILPLFANPP